jgi:hypothetical protein
MKYHFFIFIGSIALLTACNCEEESEEQVTFISDTVSQKPIAQIDSLIMADSSNYVSQNKEEEANVRVIEEKYGKQWDFCDCVQKNDSINKVIENAGDDADYDQIMARMEEIDKHCKTLLIQPNSTPEERDSYEGRVKKCLQNRKKIKQNHEKE